MANQQLACVVARVIVHEREGRRERKGGEKDGMRDGVGRSEGWGGGSLCFCVCFLDRRHERWREGREGVR